jgi:hypothetical protein
MRPALSHFKRSNCWTKDRVRGYPTAIASRGDFPSGRGLPARLLLRIEIAELLPAAVLHDEAGAGVLDGPRRREAAGKVHSGISFDLDQTVRFYGADNWMLNAEIYLPLHNV